MDDRVPDGFTGQRLVTIPRRIVDDRLTVGVTRRLLVTAAGFYPVARNHGVERPNGISGAICGVCSAGAGWITVDGIQHRMTGRNAMIIPAGSPHAYHSDDADPWTLWWCVVEGEDVSDLTADLHGSLGQPTVPVRRMDLAITLFDELTTSYERGLSPASILDASGIAWRILAQLLADQSLPSSGHPLDHAMQFLSLRFRENVPVSALAKMVGLSPSHLSTLFRTTTGESVVGYRTALRMARARTLLDVTDQSVADIGAAVGYADVFYFSRQFRKYHGQSPTIYRRRERA